MADASADVLSVGAAAWEAMVAHTVACYPEEMCGLIAGPARTAERFYPCRNDAASARVYTINPHDHLRAELDAEARGWEISGVVHSHTHTEAYPSATDVAQAPDPGWYYVIVTMKRDTPEIRGYRIVGGVITELEVQLS